MSDKIETYVSIKDKLKARRLAKRERSVLSGSSETPSSKMTMEKIVNLAAS